ncbi:MAG: TraB/GumN family protein [Candidatus Nanohaloarchaea archaeon]
MRETVDLGDRKVTLVGTAHVSKESLEEVRDTIEEIGPDLVGVELDQDRYESLTDREGWKDLNIVEAIRDGKGYVLFLNLLLSIYQRQIGLEEGVIPGEEMIAAIDEAEERDIEFSLIDRNISETFERLREELSFWEKAKLVGSALYGEVGEDVEIEDLKQENVLNQLVNELKDEFPGISRVFIDERNSYMVENILEKDFEHAVIVVGAAHVDGIKKMLKDQKKTDLTVSKRHIPWMTILKYGMPSAIILGLGYSFYQIGWSTGVKATAFWIMSNGLLAMSGAILARSHVSTWIISFLAAPLTSLDPALGAGMVAAYFEGKMHPPTVDELENIAYIDDYRKLWHNQVGRILLAFIFVTIGSAAATFISAGYIASLIGL